MNDAIRYLIFDVESVADGDLVSQIRFPDEHLDATSAVRRYREQLLEKYESDFIPYSYQYPVSVVVGKVDADFRLQDLVALDDPEFRPHVITENFWRGWEAYRRPTFVTFNGRTFDLPLMELSAFRFGIPIAGWLSTNGPGYQQPRYRYNTETHLDLYDLLTNFGATRLSGGLNLAATLLGKPGKMTVQGHMVQDMFEQGRLAEINDYCRCDVLDTYFVFLRTAVIRGLLPLEGEQALIVDTKQWLADRAEDHGAYRTYLEHWGDWANPWTATNRTEPT